MSNISYLAIKTIIVYVVKDFFREFQFNVLAPLITTILFVFIFSTLDRFYTINQSTSYINFLVPGIVMLVIIQTSFNHLSEIIINMKQIGSFNDYLISPMSRIELFISLIISSIIVCLIIGLINLFILSIFANFETINLITSIYYMIICILIFSSLGALTGFLFFTWDVQSTISNFIVLPISFLSGTFFSIELVEKKFLFIFQYNPIYYLVKGFRSSFNSNYELNLYYNLFLLTLAFLIIFFSMFIFKKGYRVIF